MIEQDSWQHSNVIVRGEILRFMKDKLLQKLSVAFLYFLYFFFFFFFFFLYIGLLEMTQLTRKLPIALRLILRGSPGPTA